MAGRFFRLFFWGILVASLLAWLFAGLVNAEFREAILVEDRYNGIEEGPILPGEIRFVPAAAVPGRVRLHSVDLGPRILALNTRYALPEAVFYGLEETLSVEMKLYYQYELDPQNLRTLFINLPRPQWASLDEYLAVRINAYWKQKIHRWVNDGEANQIEDRLRESIDNGLAAELSGVFEPEGIRFKRILVDAVFVPDPARSQALLARAPELLERKLETDKIVDEARARSRANQILNDGYYNRLETMAGLLRKHPQLREYIAIDQLADNVQVIVMPQDQLFGNNSPFSSMNQSLDRLKPEVQNQESRDIQNPQNFQRDAFDRPAGADRFADRPQDRVMDRPAYRPGNGNFTDLTPP